MTEQPGASSSAKFNCPECEDFGTVVGPNGQGTRACTADGCRAAARLESQGDQSASVEATVPGSSPEAAR